MDRVGEVDVLVDDDPFLDAVKFDDGGDDDGVADLDVGGAV